MNGFPLPRKPPVTTMPNIVEILPDAVGGYFAHWRTDAYVFLGQALLTPENVEQIVSPLVRRGFVVEDKLYGLDELYGETDACGAVDADSAGYPALFVPTEIGLYARDDREYRYLWEDAFPLE